MAGKGHGCCKAGGCSFCLPIALAVCLLHAISNMLHVARLQLLQDYFVGAGVVHLADCVQLGRDERWVSLFPKSGSVVCGEPMFRRASACYGKLATRR